MRGMERSEKKMARSTAKERKKVKTKETHRKRKKEKLITRRRINHLDRFRKHDRIKQVTR